jgi:PKD repeat protein
MNPTFATSVLALALIGCTPPGDLPSDPRDITWDVPGFTTHFDGEGVEVRPEEGPFWRWELQGIHAEGSDHALTGVSDVPPSDAQTQSFDRGAIVEHYVHRGDRIEQQFLIARPLALGGRDLVIDGSIDSDGDFEDALGSWTWTSADGTVALGDVTVYDATGAELAARMEVTADSTRIVVDADALARATYPVVVDPVISLDDLRISSQGPDGDPAFRANDAAIAWNSADDGYLVVWDGDRTAGELEVYGQRVAADGSLVGAAIPISTQGPDGHPSFDARDAAVAYAPGVGYLVVWSGDVTAGKDAIHGRFVSADGTMPGAPFRISTHGLDTDTTTDAVDPQVAYNPTSGVFQVVWRADEVNGEERIHGRTVSSAAVLGTQQLVSADLVGGEDAMAPTLAVGSDGNVVVAWRGDTTNGREIFGRLLDSAGVPTGVDVQLTTQAEAAVAVTAADNPSLAYDPAGNVFALVYDGQDGASPAVTGSSRALYGVELSATMVPAGPPLRLTGETGEARVPVVVHNADAGGYAIVWQEGPLGAREITWQERDAGLFASGSPADVSAMGGGAAGFEAQDPAAVFNATAKEWFAVYEGDDTVPGDEDDEVFARRLAPSNLAPVAATTGPYTNTIGNDVLFGDASTDADGTVVAWSWAFGDGTTSTLQNPSHTYATGGLYDVSLTVTDDDGATHTAFTTAEVGATLAANPTIPAVGAEGTPVAFTGAFTGPSGSHTFLWSFGDGTTSTLQNPAHTFADGGVYTVTFTVTETGSGATDTASGSITVTDVGPVADASWPAGGDEGSALAFSASPTDPGNDGPYTYAWDFGDGTTSTAPSPSHTYTDDGSFTARLVVTDAEGLPSAEETTVIVIANVDPVADAGGPYSGPAGAIALSGSAVDPGDDTLVFSWDLGDGSTATGPTPTHVYATGSYTATLTVTDGDGGTGIATASVVVGAVDTVQPALDAMFVYANTAYTDLFGGPDVIGPGLRWEPAVIEQRMRPILEALENGGCRTDGSVQSYMAGAYSTPLLTGFHDAGDTPISGGMIGTSPKVLGATLDGTGLSFGEPGSFSVYNRQAQSFAVRSDGGFAAGRFFRVLGTRGVWLGWHGTCDGPVDAATALDGWYRGGLP